MSDAMPDDTQSATPDRDDDDPWAAGSTATAEGWSGDLPF